MISRIMLSLRKVADSLQNGWSLGEPSTGIIHTQGMNFLRPQKTLNTSNTEDIQLDTYADS